MCEITEGFKFCTCGSDVDEPGPDKAEYIWRLTRFIGVDDDGPVGSIVGPSEDLGKGLTVPNVLRILNSGDGFDFAYTPVEKDALMISRAVKGAYRGYMSFIYIEGQWLEGMNPPFTTKTEELAKGNVFKD